MFPKTVMLPNRVVLPKTAGEVNKVAQDASAELPYSEIKW